MMGMSEIPNVVASKNSGGGCRFDCPHCGEVHSTCIPEFSPFVTGCQRKPANVRVVAVVHPGGVE